MANMLEKIPNPDRHIQIASVMDSLKRGGRVSQSDIKTAVHGVIELQQKSNHFSGDVELAFALGNHHFWRAGTENAIHLDTDEELAEDLRQLQQRAIRVLQVELKFVPQINCNYGPRSKSDIELDTQFVEHKILAVDKFIGDLIAQASPKDN